MKKIPFNSFSVTYSKYGKFYSRLQKRIADGTFWRMSVSKRKMLFKRLKKQEEKLQELTHQVGWRQLTLPTVSALLLFATKGIKAEAAPEIEVVENRIARLMAISIDSSQVQAYAGRGTVVGTLTGTGPVSLVAGVGDDDNGLFTIIGNQLVVNDYIWKKGKPSLSILVQDTIPSIQIINITVTGLPVSSGTRAFADAGLSFANDSSLAVKSGDIDLDGNLDVVVLKNNGFSIHYGDGLGGFSADSLTKTYANINRDFELGDLDNDGDLDVVVAGSFGPGTYPVFINQRVGNGSGFTVQNDFNLYSSYIYSLGLGDLDQDGDLDLIIEKSTSVVLYSNDGYGNFTTNYAGGITGYGKIADLGDVDGDGDLDLLLTKSTGAVVYLGKASYGNFYGSVLVDTLSSASDGILFDVDGDGDLDAFLANNYGNSVFQNDGAGGFTDLSQVFGIYNFATAAGDLDGDGDLDMLLGDNQNLFVPLLNNGTGTGFTYNLPALGTKYLTRDVALGDFDKDGDLDVFVANYGAADKLYTNRLNNPITDITFSATTVSVNAKKGEVIGALSVADIDGDSVKYSLVPGIGSKANGAFSILNNQLVVDGDLFGYKGPLEFRVLADDKLGQKFEKTFLLTLADLPTSGGVFATTDSLGNRNSKLAQFADVDGDSNLDAIVFADSSMLVWKGNGTGGFAATPDSLVTGYVNDFEIGDIDNDGDLDIVMASNSSASMVLLNNAGSFSSQYYYSWRSYMDVSLGDLDDDGDLDAIFSVLGDGPYVRVFENDGFGNFSDTYNSHGITLGIGNYMDEIKLADFDSDGDLDAVVTINNQLSAYFNEPNGQYAMGIGFGRPQLIDSLVTDFKIADLDSDGDLDILTNKANNPVFLFDSLYGFTPSGQTFAGNYGGGSLALGDMDGDGDIDAFLTNTYGVVSLALNDGFGTFSFPGTTIGDSIYTQSLALADIDKDGDLDAFLVKGGQLPLPDLLVLNTTPPVLSTNTGLVLNEGATHVITTAELEVTDADQLPAEIIFILDQAPVNGSLQLNATALNVGQTFTQADINSGLLHYVHNGAELFSDSLAFSFTDGIVIQGGNSLAISITPVNDNSPFITVNAGATVVENNQVALGVVELSASDLDNPPSDSLVFTLSAGPA
ncbi:MAG: FG-GAP-like repeat-containing protein, partial [Cyclobacteriaceae bacterium]|nr:FG-GAP-like repeat-containing protein [Cyclobacteriaceae bacterium]